ncbi:ImmA/IrrE family metallo-endopeptidase [Peribacillus butanolivorans]|uniref:ImmA/IrrE family metallo-endopeptidase n=1 Tax=Peribacillus butanolivorans TaxID=421767 RepID=UPI0036C40C2B
MSFVGNGFLFVSVRIPQEFAHELCHILRHDGNQIYMPKMFIKLQENQANYFTYHFCILHAH